MKRITPFLLLVIILFNSCNNDCQDLLDNINQAKSNFQNNPTVANCLAYESALNGYLNSSCQNSNGINYTAIFQNDLSTLLCDTFPTVVDPCFNGVQDGSETGVDCGGSCSPCATTGPTCTDGIQNGNETGVDCGGTICPPCGTSPTCTDGIQNGSETGIDCGGTCPPCNVSPPCSITTAFWNFDGFTDGSWAPVQTGIDSDDDYFIDALFSASSGGDLRLEIPTNAGAFPTSGTYTTVNISNLSSYSGGVVSMELWLGLGVPYLTADAGEEVYIEVTSTEISISFCNLNFSGSGVDLGVLEGNITAPR